ncbi:protein OSCP1 isoform X2 [Periplaneta americana]|uniref:protein OSCP1 isoform X2 n=1 Tax=Periplaneta americana TaxID=6978 RepID=UPI0037E7331E
MHSAYAVPLLFLNLGVMNDIVGIMLNEKFLVQLFKPQVVYNKIALRKLFEDLAHASIMRLDTASMDKLYDLMTMAFKYQVLMARQPLELLLITMNHLDAIRNFVSTPVLQSQVDKTYMMLMKTYAHLSIGEMQTLRYTLLNFLQGCRVRVSVFLRQKVQNADGTFVIPTCGPVPAGCEVPGFIRSFDPDGEVCQIRHFNSGGDYASACEPGSMELRGNRGTDLGCNIYKVPVMVDSSPLSTYYNNNDQMGHTSPSAEQAHYQDLEADGVRLGKEELNLLMAQLLGNRTDHKQDFHSNDVIRLNLFGAEEQTNVPLQEEELGPSNLIHIDARNRSCSAALDRVYGEMTVQRNEVAPQEDREQDLLDLLDSVL